jgi:hypothetical protein
MKDTCDACLPAFLLRVTSGCLQSLLDRILALNPACLLAFTTKLRREPYIQTKHLPRMVHMHP